MQSKLKKPISLVLVFVMALSLAQFTPSTANAEEVGVDNVICDVDVYAPYQAYYQSSNFDGEVAMDKTDLADDFGIGLATDSTAKFTALRALAKMIRSGVMKEKGITDKTTANALMKNYINVSPTQYGLSLNGLSNDGVNWNTGAYSDTTKSANGDFSTTDYDGYWAFYVNDGYADSGVDSYAITSSYDKDIQLRWVSKLNDGSYAGHGSFDVPNSRYLLANKSYSITLLSSDYTGTKNTVTGADVKIIGYGDGAGIPTEVATAKTGSQGAFDLKLPAGSYMITAVADEINDTTKLTHSIIEYTQTYIYVVDKTAKAKSITAKSKKSGKKYNLTVSWKNGSKYADARTVYQVYISKKKNSGYGKAKATADGNYTKATIKGLKKGTYYVKIQATTYYGNDDEVAYKSGYTTPKKIKVK